MILPDPVKKAEIGIQAPVLDLAVDFIQKNRITQELKGSRGGLLFLP